MPASVVCDGKLVGYKRAPTPATTHADGSGRLQTVHRDTDPLCHHLISAFRDLTSVPMILNTSFNENEPVVCSPQEALDCFLRTKNGRPRAWHVDGAPLVTRNRNKWQKKFSSSSAHVLK